MAERKSVRNLIDDLLAAAAPEDAVRLQRVIAAIPPIDDADMFAALAADTLRAVGRAEGGGSASRAAAAVEAACGTSAFPRRVRAASRPGPTPCGKLCA